MTTAMNILVVIVCTIGIVAFAWWTRTLKAAGAGGTATPTPPTRSDDAAALRRFLRAIGHVESGNLDHPKGGNGGGRYQLTYGHAKDARPGLTKTQFRAKVADPFWCEATMLLYWKRYCQKALAGRDWETLARVHRKGWRGRNTTTATAYWARVRAAMEAKP